MIFIIIIIFYNDTKHSDKKETATIRGKKHVSNFFIVLIDEILVIH